jgi:hypothetical protein
MAKSVGFVGKGSRKQLLSIFIPVSSCDFVDHLLSPEIGGSTKSHELTLKHTQGRRDS